MLSIPSTGGVGQLAGLVQSRSIHVTTHTNSQVKDIQPSHNKLHT